MRNSVQHKTAVYTLSYTTWCKSSACSRAMEQPPHNPVPIPAGYANRYLATSSIRPDFKIRIRYIPSTEN